MVSFLLDKRLKAELRLPISSHKLEFTINVSFCLIASHTQRDNLLLTVIFNNVTLLIQLELIIDT